MVAETDDNSAPTLVLDSVAGNDGTNTLAHITGDGAGYYSYTLTAGLVGISIGVTRLVQLLIAKRGLTASRSTPAAVLVAVSAEEERPASLAVATALRARGIPCEVAPAADRFGNNVCRGQLRTDFAHGFGLHRTGDDKNILGRHERTHALERLYQ